MDNTPYIPVDSSIHGIYEVAVLYKQLLKLS